MLENTKMYETGVLLIIEQLIFDVLNWTLQMIVWVGVKA